MKKYLDKDQYRMYELIWQRFVASQMADALYDTTAVDIAAGDYTFRASGSILRFAGFLAAYADLEKKPDDDSEAASETDRLLPPAQRGRCAEAARHRSEAALHAATAALQRGNTRPRARA